MNNLWERTVINFSKVPQTSLLGRLCRLPLALLPKGMVLPILQGPCKGMYWVVGSSTHGCWLGSYEAPKMRAFGKAIRPGDVVYDIGANAGIYTLAASRLAQPEGGVVAIEPLPRNIALLRRHLKLNSCRNVTVLPIALSDENGEALFDDSCNASMGHLSPAGRLVVTVSKLDDAIKDHCLPLPQVVKMDVEGAEAKVLCGAERVIREAKPTIFLATHSDEVKKQCLDWLRGYGYSIEVLGQGDEESADEFIARFV